MHQRQVSQVHTFHPEYLKILSCAIGVTNRPSSGKLSPAQQSTNSFRGELLKFERINAHLANERTWLAWVRTALSTLSCAFAFLSLTSSGVYDVFVYILGCLFCVSVILVYVTGWLRYTRVKVILGLSFNEMFVECPRYDH